MTNSLTSPNYTLAAELMTEAEALLIGAGAGMGIDSGLPGFRGNQGFWAAYPPYHGRSFADLVRPQTFTADPELAWGFYGHRLNLYRQTQPHAGFAILRSPLNPLTPVGTNCLQPSGIPVEPRRNTPLSLRLIFKSAPPAHRTARHATPRWRSNRGAAPVRAGHGCRPRSDRRRTPGRRRECLPWSRGR